MSIATASDFEIAPTRPLLRPLISATACVALADWLFYGWQIGISLALFFGVLGAIGVASNRGRATRTIQIVIADVAGKGVPAALLMSATAAAIIKRSAPFISERSSASISFAVATCLISTP